MISQVAYVWIVLLIVTARSVYTSNSEFGHNGNGSDGATDSSSSSYHLHFKEETGMINNESDSIKSATLQNFTNTQDTIKNDTLTETMSEFSVFTIDRNETETSSFAPIKEQHTTSVNNSEEPETNKMSSVTELSKAITSETTEQRDECAPDYCTSPYNCTFTKDSGCIRLREDVTEQLLSYTIMIANESNLISVEMEPKKADLLHESNITFEFQECEKKQEKWLLKAGEKIERRIYISRTSSLTLQISTDKSWINSTLRYKELAFETIVNSAKDSEDEGYLRPPMLAGIRYRPNTQVTYRLTASKSRWNESSVMITLLFVDLDEGDYLLIGAGKNPFAGPEPFYFTGQIKKAKNYYVASDDVYVHFVSGASPKVDKKGFRIKWKRSGTAITNPDEEPEEETIPDYIIQSVGICFYNKSLLAEFNTTEGNEGALQKFREKLASVANVYAKRNSITLDSVLTASYVKIFRVSAVLEPIEDVMPEGGLYVMVSIVHHFDKKTALFRRHQLEEILDELEEQNKNSDYSMLGFRAGRCPSVDNYIHWYIAAVLLIFISTIALIVVWICTSVTRWRGLVKKRKSSDQMGTVYCKEPEIPARENDYIRYTPGINKPQVKLTTCDGDTMTLDSESPDQSRAEQDDGPDTVLFHQDWIIKKRPSSQELPRRTIATAEIEPRKPFLQPFPGSLPSARRKGSDRIWIQMDSLLPQDNTQQVDHEYDSLIFPGTSSTSTTCLVTHDGETKL